MNLKLNSSSHLYSAHDHDSNGRSPLELAIGGQHVAATRVLLEHAGILMSRKGPELGKGMSDFVEDIFVGVKSH